MSTSTVGVKLSPDMRDRLKKAAHGADRTPHFVIKQLILHFIERSERGDVVTDLLNFPVLEDDAASSPSEAMEGGVATPFVDFAENVRPQSTLRAAITSAYRRPETEAVPMLLEQARLPDSM